MQNSENTDQMPSESDLLRDCLDGKITPAEYMDKKDLLVEYRQNRSKLEEKENQALMIEREILRCKGVKTNRQFGEIPNPWKAGQLNLTNQSRLIAEGDRTLIEFLASDAGVILPNYAAKEKAEAEAKQKYQDDYRRKTEEIRKTNQALANRSLWNQGG